MDVTAFSFVLRFDDGRTEEVTVQAPSFNAAIFGLPRFADAGRYKYEVMHKRKKEGKEA